MIAACGAAARSVGDVSSSLSEPPEVRTILHREIRLPWICVLGKVSHRPTLEDCHQLPYPEARKCLPTSTVLDQSGP